MLLTENVNATSWPLLDEGATGLVWTNQNLWLQNDQPMTAGRQYGINLGFEQYTDNTLLEMSQSSPDQLISIARPSSNHSGGVNMLFADGHVEFVSNEMHPWVYARRLSSNKTQAVYPGEQVGMVEAQISGQDQAGNLVPTEF